MADPHDSFREKVSAIFTELVGPERAARLRPDVPFPITSVVVDALGYDDAVLGDQIATHVTDWQADAAFLVALHLFPERFTPEEISAGVQALLLHAPAHVIAAARLSGYSTEDIFRDDSSA
jgi:hypothetical protein